MRLEREGVFVTYGSSLQPVFERVVSLISRGKGKEGGRFRLSAQFG